MKLFKAIAFLALAAAVLAAAVPLGAQASSRSDRIDQELNFARLELRGSDGRAFRPARFILAGPDGAYEAASPRRFDADRASGIPAARMPLIGGVFRPELMPPPGAVGAPVYAVGDAMALDLRAISAADWSDAMAAAGGRGMFLITSGRLTVIALRLHFRANMFAPTPTPDFGSNQIGEAFMVDGSLVVVPLVRDFYGTRPW